MRRPAVRSLGTAITLMMVAFVVPLMLGGVGTAIVMNRALRTATTTADEHAQQLRALAAVVTALRAAEAGGPADDASRTPVVSLRAGLDRAFARARARDPAAHDGELTAAGLDARQAVDDLQSARAATRARGAEQLEAAEHTVLLRLDRLAGEGSAAVLAPMRSVADGNRTGVTFGVAVAMLTALGASLWTRRAVRRPLRALLTVARRVGEGDLEPVAVSGLKDFEPIVEALNTMTAQLREDRSSLVHRAYHDPLTRLPNRALLFESVEAALATGDETVVLYIDLNGFKAVNDRHGHAVGDRLLVHVAHRLRVGLRPDDLLARLGGDEFAVLLDGDPSLADAEAVAARLRDALALPLQLGEMHVEAAASIGIARAVGAGARASTLINDADNAMYANKLLGRERRRPPARPSLADAGQPAR